MALATPSLARSLMRCPRTGRPLSFGAEEARAGDHVYPLVAGVPVLLVPENTLLDIEAILASGGASAVRRTRYRGARAVVKRLLSPRKASTRSNVAAFLTAVEMVAERPVILVIGGGTIGQGLSPLYDSGRCAIVALDVYASPFVHVVADAHDSPFADDAFDGVVVQAVLEHVLDPHRVVAEIRRVLKPRGVVYAETPFMQHVHEGAYDFTRFSELGHRWLFRGFDEIRAGSTGGPGLALMWSVDAFFRGLFRSRTAGKIAKLGVFWLQYLDRLVPETYRSDGASGVFFLGAKSATTLSPRDLPDRYRGAQ